MEAQTWIRPGLRNRALLNLCQAVPSWPAAQELDDEVARLAHEAGTSLYTDIFGIAELRSAIATHMAQDYGGHISADEVCVTSGCNQAFAAAMMAIAKAGDNAVVPEIAGIKRASMPSMPSHMVWLKKYGTGTTTLSPALAIAMRAAANAWLQPDVTQTSSAEICPP